jgi:hypothetical protein
MADHQAAVSSKFARIRAAKAARTAAVKAAEAQRELSTLLARQVLEPWRQERLALLEAEYQAALRQHAPGPMAAFDQAVAAADANYQHEVDDAEEEFEAFRAAAARAKGEAAFAKKEKQMLADGWKREQRGWLEEHLWPWVAAHRITLEEYVARWEFAEDDRPEHERPAVPPHLAAQGAHA